MYPHLLVIVFLVLLSGCRSSEPKRPDDILEITDYQCTPAREFIATMNFLRDRPAFGLKDDKSKEVALAVAAGCRGAAKRFIQTTDILIQAGIPSAAAIETAVLIGKGEEDQGDAFLAVFKSAFLPRGLDMKAEEALAIANALSIEFRGSRKKAVRDFELLVEFCIESSSIDLPKPKCGEIASKIASKGQNNDDGVAKPFIRTIEFLTSSSDGPQLVLYQAITIAESLALNSPNALDNYVQAYKWVTSKAGMSLERKDAVELAKTIALKTAQKRLVRFTGN